MENIHCNKYLKNDLLWSNRLMTFDNIENNDMHNMFYQINLKIMFH